MFFIHTDKLEVVLKFAMANQEKKFKFPVHVAEFDVLMQVGYVYYIFVDLF